VREAVLLLPKAEVGNRHVPAQRRPASRKKIEVIASDELLERREFLDRFESLACLEELLRHVQPQMEDLIRIGGGPKALAEHLGPLRVHKDVVLYFDSLVKRLQALRHPARSRATSIGQVNRAGWNGSRGVGG